MTRIDTRYGRLAVPDTEDDLIGRFLARYGEWAWLETCFIASVLAPGARVLDGGAFLGTFALGLARQAELAGLCCVEANPAILPLLADNLARLAGVPAIAVGRLLAGADAAARHGETAPDNLGGMRFTTVGEGAPSEPAMSLAALRAEHGPFDLIKLDIEGLEAEVLESDAAYLAGGQAALWLECNETPDSLRLARLLLGWGLELYYFAFPSHNPDNAAGDAQPIYPFAYEAGLLAAPRRAPVLDDALAGAGCRLQRITGEDELRRAMWTTPRWGERDWLGADGPALVALAGRGLRGQAFDDFLRPGTDTPLQPATDGAVARVEALARARLAEAEALRDSLAVTEHRLAEASARTLDLLAQIGATHERQLALEHDLAVARQRARALEAALQAERAAREQAEALRRSLEASLAWRTLRWLGRGLRRVPLLDRAARRGVAALRR